MYDFLLVTNSNFGRICYRFWDIDAWQESPAVADKPARRESMAKIAPIRRAYNVVADNTIFIRLADVASEICEIMRNSLRIQT